MKDCGAVSLGGAGDSSPRRQPGGPRTFIALAVLFTAAAGCGSDRAADGRREVRVAAAADLRFAFDDIASAFRATHPGIAVKVTYGSSGNFVAQLANEAPFDLFLSADIDYPRQLTDAELYRYEMVPVSPNAYKFQVDGNRAVLDPKNRARKFFGGLEFSAMTVTAAAGPTVVRTGRSSLLAGNNVSSATSARNISRALPSIAVMAASISSPRWSVRVDS